MSRRMSCSMTIDAVRDRTKTVTRRHVDTWTTLKPGDRLTLIEKGMGLPKDAKQVVLAEVEIVDVRVEFLRELVYEFNGCTAEGFPDYLLASCFSCHARIHQFPAVSYERGWLLRRGAA